MGPFRQARWGLGALAWVLAAGCSGDALSLASPPLPDTTIRVPLPERAAVDILVVVDDSRTMAWEQHALAERFPDLIRQLVDPPDSDGDGTPDHPPIDDLQIGVITPDMGTQGQSTPSGWSCPNADAGDDGCLRHGPSPLLDGCADDYPTFLERHGGIPPTTALAEDFRCLATLGTGGCGWEQSLLAARKAVTDDARPGGCNEGFLRGGSVLVVIWVTDEDDCSVAAGHPEMFDPERMYDLGHPNMRGFLNPELLEPVESYVAAFGLLRAGRPRSVVLGMIVGVPPVAECTGPAAALGGCLGLPEMQPTIDPFIGSGLLPSCSSEAGQADPAVRFVELAQAWAALGREAYVGSICDEDWTDIVRGIAQSTAHGLWPRCFSHELDFDATDDGDLEPPDVCRSDCLLIRTVAEGERCLSGGSCPPEWCPPATPADAERGDLAPCRNPAMGATCEPLERDLGAVDLGDGSGRRRQCLVRQALRTFDSARRRCGSPSTDGWFYVPPAWSTDERDPCPEVVLPLDLLTHTGGSSELEVRCAGLPCPASRQCGPRAAPASVCCPDGTSCSRVWLGQAGTCL